jgi:hypothetical protein
MTPRIYNRIAVRLASYENRLSKYGLLFLVLFIVSISINFIYSQTLFPLVIAPLGITFLIAGIGMIIITYKKHPEGRYTDFEEYWKSSSFGSKIVLWYGAIFLNIWNAGVIFITLLVIIVSVLILYGYIIS